jgi:GNAT superfamily N-acetyltransferase
VRIESFPEALVPHAMRVRVVALQDRAWPGDRASDAAPWHDPALSPVSMVLLDNDDAVVAALDILSKHVSVAGAHLAASGLSAVVTDPDRRGEGHGTALCAAAREYIEASGADLGIFTCDRELLGFYVGAGWEHLEGTVLIGGTPDDPFPSDGDGFDKVALGGFFTTSARAARADVVGARVELYPGLIDRLW